MYVTNGQSDDKNLITKTGNQFGFGLTNSNTFFKVVLDHALKAGDVISFNIKEVDATGNGLWFTTASSRPQDSNPPTAKSVVDPNTSQSWVTAPTYTVATGDGICGETTFYIYRATGKSTYFNTFTITRSL